MPLEINNSLSDNSKLELDINLSKANQEFDKLKTKAINTKNELIKSFDDVSKSIDDLNKKQGQLTKEEKTNLNDLIKKHNEYKKEINDLEDSIDEYDKRILKLTKNTNSLSEQLKDGSDEIFKFNLYLNAAKKLGIDVNKNFELLINSYEDIKSVNISTAKGVSVFNNKIKELGKSNTNLGLVLKDVEKQIISYEKSPKRVFENLKKSVESYRKQAELVSKNNKQKKYFLELANAQEAVTIAMKKMGTASSKYVGAINNAKDIKDYVKIVQDMNVELSKEIPNPFDEIVSKNVISKTFKEGSEEVQNYAKALKGLPFAGAAVGTYMLAKGINNLSDKFSDSITKYKSLKREMAVSLVPSVGGFPSTIKDLTNLGKSFNLTREETARFGKVLKESAKSGIGFDKVNSIASNLQKTMGELDVSELASIVDLLKTLPDQQIDFAITGKGSFDDEAGLMMNLMKQGKLSEYIEMQAKGAFGVDMLAEKGFTEGDKELIKTNKAIESTIDDFKSSMSDMIGGKTLPYLITISSGIISIAGTVSTIAFTLGAIKGMIGVSGGATKQIEGGVSKTLNFDIGKFLKDNFLKDKNIPATSKIPKLKDMDPGARSITQSITALSNNIENSSETVSFSFSNLADKAKSFSGNLSLTTGQISKLGKIGLIAGQAIGGIGTAATVAVAAFEAGQWIGEKIGLGEEGKITETLGNTLAEVMVGSIGSTAKETEEITNLRKKECAIIEKEKKKRLDGIMAIEEYSSRMKRIEGVAEADKGLRETMENQIKIFRNLGGSLSSYQDILTKSLKYISQAYIKEANELRKARKEAVEDERLNSAQKTALILQATQQEAKIAEDFVNSLTNSIGKYNEIPNVLINTLKSSMETMKKDFVEWSGMIGSSFGLLNSNIDILGNSLDSAVKSLNQYIIENDNATKSINEINALKGTVNKETFDKTFEETKSAGFNIKKVDIGEGKISDKVQEVINENDKALSEQLKELENKRSNTQEKIKQANSLLKISKTGEYRDEFVNLQENLSATDEGSDKFRQEYKKFIENRIEKMSDIGVDNKDVKSLFEKFKSTNNEKDLMAAREKYYEVMNKALNKDELQKEVDLYDQQITIGQKMQSQLLEVNRQSNASVISTKVLEQTLGALKEQMGKVSEAYKSIITDVEKSTGVQTWKKMQEKIESESVYSKRMGKGLEYYSDSLDFQAKEIKAQSKAIEDAKQSLDNVKNKTQEFKNVWNNVYNDVSNIQFKDEASKQLHNSLVNESKKLMDAQILAAEAMKNNDIEGLTKAQSIIDEATKSKAEIIKEINKNYEKELSDALLSKSEEAQKYKKAKEDETEKIKSIENKKEQAKNVKGKEQNNLEKEIKSEEQELIKLTEIREKAEEALAQEGSSTIKLKHAMDKLNSTHDVTTASVGLEVSAYNELNILIGKTKSKIIDTFDKLDKMVDDIVSNDAKMRKLATNMEKSQSAMELAGMELDPETISKVGRKLREATIAEEEERLRMTKEIGQKQLELAEMSLKQSGISLDSEEGRTLMAKQQALVDKQNIEAEVNMKKKVVEMAKQEFDMQKKAVDYSEQSLQTELDIMDSIGGPFETIYGIEVEMVRLAQSKADIAQEELATMEKLHEEGKASEEEVMKARIEARKAEGEVIKKQMGAQRSAMEKLLGGLMTGWKQVGAFKGPSRAAKFGAGYMVEGDVDTGTVWQTGEEATAQARAKGIRGYNDRVSRTNLAAGWGTGETFRGTGISAKRIGGLGAEGLASGMKNKNKDIMKNKSEKNDNVKDKFERNKDFNYQNVRENNEKTDVMIRLVDVIEKLNKTLNNLQFVQLQNNDNKSQFFTGGYTGGGGVKEPKGIVHGGEYVIPKWLVESNPELINTLEDSRQSKSKLVPYANGGLVKAGKKTFDAYNNYRKAKNVEFVNSDHLPTYDRKKDIASNIWGMGMQTNSTIADLSAIADSVETVSNTVSKGTSLVNKAFDGAKITGNIIKVSDKIANVASKTSNVLGLGNVLDKTGQISKFAKVGGKVGVGSAIAATNVLASGLDTVYTDEEGNLDWSLDTDMRARLANKGEKSLQAGSSGVFAGMWEGASNPVQTIAGATKGVIDIVDLLSENKKKEEEIRKNEKKLADMKKKKSVKGYADGGFTAKADANEPVGIVHGGEYVVPRWQVQNNPELINQLEDMRKSHKKYKKGGFVGIDSKINMSKKKPKNKNTYNEIINENWDAPESESEKRFNKESMKSKLRDQSYRYKNAKETEEGLKKMQKQMVPSQVPDKLIKDASKETMDELAKLEKLQKDYKDIDSSYLTENDKEIITNKIKNAQKELKQMSDVEEAKKKLEELNKKSEELSKNTFNTFKSDYQKKIKEKDELIKQEQDLASQSEKLKDEIDPEKIIRKFYSDQIKNVDQVNSLEILEDAKKRSGMSEDQITNIRKEEYAKAKKSKEELESYINFTKDLSPFKTEIMENTGINPNQKNLNKLSNSNNEMNVKLLSQEKEEKLAKLIDKFKTENGNIDTNSIKEIDSLIKEKTEIAKSTLSKYASGEAPKRMDESNTNRTDVMSMFKDKSDKDLLDFRDTIASELDNYKKELGGLEKTDVSKLSKEQVNKLESDKNTKKNFITDYENMLSNANKAISFRDQEVKQQDEYSKKVSDIKKIDEDKAQLSKKIQSYSNISEPERMVVANSKQKDEVYKQIAVQKKIVDSFNNKQKEIEELKTKIDSASSVDNIKKLNPIVKKESVAPKLYVTDKEHAMPSASNTTKSPIKTVNTPPSPIGLSQGVTSTSTVGTTNTSAIKNASKSSNIPSAKDNSELGARALDAMGTANNAFAQRLDVKVMVEFDSALFKKKVVEIIKGDNIPQQVVALGTKTTKEIIASNGG